MKLLAAIAVIGLLAAAPDARAQIFNFKTFTLPGNNVATGTNRFTGPVTITNTGSIFAGDGSGLTGLTASGIATSAGLGTNTALRGLTVTVGMTNSDLAVSTVPYTGSAGKLTSSAVTPTELGFLSALTGGVQTNLDARASLSGLNTLSNAVTAASNSVVTVSNSVTTVQNTLATNTVLLNGTNVFAGTNRFAGEVFLTNANNVLAGDGSAITGISGGSGAPLNGTNVWTGTNTFTAANFFPVNKIGYRLLFVTNNLFASSLATLVTPTNSGDFSLCSKLIEVTLPPLLGSNSIVKIGFLATRTNLNASVGNFAVYVGTNTNCVSYRPTVFATTLGATIWHQPMAAVLKNQNSFTRQRSETTTLWPGAAGDNHNLYNSNYTDTSQAFKFYVGFWTAGTYTNLFVDSFWVEEQFVY